MSLNIHLPHKMCYGCYGCFNICPREAISMIPDKYGYKHPFIDPEKCIECHLCEKVCTEINPLPRHAPRSVVGAVTKDRNELSTVASGGICTALGREIINRGGVVYGCCEKNYLSISHIRVDTSESLELLKKSKYVYSDINNIFKSLRKDLCEGRDVLFIGTPCQVSGLYGFLMKPFDNLYTVDLVCHGVPSQQMLQDQVKLFFGNKTNKFSCGTIDFRWKSRYGIRYGIRFVMGGKCLVESGEWENPYMAAFSKGYSYRENCYSCPFACCERVSDITAADFWGLGKEIKSSFKDTEGVSMVMLNSDKGERLFDSVIGQFNIESHTVEEAKKCNANLSHPTPFLKEHNNFIKIYAEKGLETAAKECIKKYRKNTNLLYRTLYRMTGLVKLYSILLKLKNGNRK